MGRKISDIVKDNFKNKMEYPQEFIDKCLKAYPDNEEVKQLLDDKSFLLGSFLREHMPKEITSKELSESPEKAIEVIIKRELVRDFDLLYETQYLRKSLHMTSVGMVESDPSGITEFNLDIKDGKVPIKTFKIDPVKHAENVERMKLRDNYTNMRLPEDQRRYFN